jgi:tRNA U34 5-methylaminomethyl-2-thiouridine-forming methyltransferase MnmC
LQEGAQVTTLPMRRIVLDTDFGSGERFAAERAACAGPLHYLAAAPQLPEAASIGDAELRALWPLDVPGFHRIVLADGRVVLDLLVGALDALLPQVNARVDAFFVAAPAPAATDPAPATALGRRPPAIWLASSCRCCPRTTISPRA